MCPWKIVRLQFTNNRAHFGEVGIGLEETGERVRSDTLFSAFINSYARLFGGEAVEQLLQEFNKSSKPPLTLSSTFIYQQKNQQITYYLPKPLKFPYKYPKDDLEFFKRYKNLKYLPLSVWKRWYQSEEGFKERDLTDNYQDTFKIHQQPKVAIDRTNASSNFYHTGLVEFNSEPDNTSGLYFLVNFASGSFALEKSFYAALNLLGEEGLGGEKSSGAGRFDIVACENLSGDWSNVTSYAKATHHTLLSLFWSSSLEDNFLEDSSYELLERGGWISSGSSGRQLRRKKVQMFSEGSIFKQSPKGSLANVTPDGFRSHHIYRSGISLSLPIRCQ